MIMDTTEIKLEKENNIYNQQCHVCLSVGRKLLPLGQYTYIFMLITSAQKYLFPSVSEKMLCWECHGLLRKVSNFQHKVWRAKELLQLGQNYVNRSLSTLTTVINNEAESYTMYVRETNIKTDTQTDIKIDDNIKDNDSNQHLEENDFIQTNDLDDIKEENELTNDSYDIGTEPPKMKPKKERDMEKNKNRYRWHNSRILQNKKPKYNIITNYTIDDLFKKNPISIDEVDTTAASERDREYKSSKWKCDRCIKGFQKEFSYLAHYKTYHGKNKVQFICDICNKRMDNKLLLAAHIATHYLEYECRLCDYRTLRARHQATHLKICHNYIYQCVRCGLIFGNRREFFSHFKEWHRNFKCDHCGQNFKMRYCIIQHIRSLHSQHECKPCGKRFNLLRGLWAHNRKHHPPPSPCPSPAAPSPGVYCVECDKHFPDRARYGWHLSTLRHRAPRRYPCPDCDKVFSKNIYMKEHRDMVHLKCFKFRCETCDTNYLRKSALDRHKKRVHEGIPPVKNKMCSWCGRGFSTNKTLENHMRTHTGERPFNCTQCDARFTQKTALTTHLRTIHSTSRPLKRKK